MITRRYRVKVRDGRKTMVSVTSLWPSDRLIRKAVNIALKRRGEHLVITDIERVL